MKRNDLVLFAALVLGVYLVLVFAGAPAGGSAHADLLRAREPDLGTPLADGSDTGFGGRRSP